VKTKRKTKTEASAGDASRIKQMSANLFRTAKRTDSIYKGGYSEMGSPPRPKKIEQRTIREKPIFSRDEMKTYAKKRTQQKASRGY
jgi:ribosomal protein S10